MLVLSKQEKQKMKIGDKVTSKTKAGLWLADVPVNSEAAQQRNSVCVFKGIGVIVSAQETLLDYDKYNAESDDDDLTHESIGVVTYRNYLVRCDAGVGWAGEGALVVVSESD